MIGLLLVITLASVSCALTAPHPASYPGLVHVPVFRRSNTSDRVANLPKIVDAIKRKYGIMTAHTKRSGGTSSGFVTLTDEQSDDSYSGVVSVGTPAQEFNMILDTGSSDLWVATTACTTCESDAHLFNPLKSSSYSNYTAPLSLDYGSGAVSGYISEDTVSFGGFTMKSQRLLSVDSTSTSGDLFKESLSGIMGLGFQSISALETPPFWQALYEQNLLSNPMFAFYLERHVNQVNKVDTTPGGTLTLGGTNASFYTGNVEFIVMPNGTTASYWFQQVQTVTVQNASISVPSGIGLAAIDTGTTLIGAPSSIAQEIWNNVPGSVALTGTYEGMYAYPCTTSVNVSLSFGGTTWPINPADMNVGTIELQSGSYQMCVGGIFDMPAAGLGGGGGGSGPSIPVWVIGDVFLKNVYAVFQADPPAVGFAHLAGGLDSLLSSRARSSTFDSQGPLFPASLCLVITLVWFVTTM